MVSHDVVRARGEAARRFAEEQIAPWAVRIDREEHTPSSVLEHVRSSGYLGAALPEEWGGGGFDPLSYGVVTEEIGFACSSVRSLLTVHDMSAQCVLRFGTPSQRERWLPDLCSGRIVMAFALSEPDVGSAAETIQLEARDGGGHYTLAGTKKWITYGQVADHFLVFARAAEGPIALVVPREAEGLRVEPIEGVLGTRGSMLAELHFDDVEVDKASQLGRAGMGIRFVANTALDHGRFSVAWGATGVIRACLEASLAYADERRQGGAVLREYQLVQRQLAEMLVAHTTARALCRRSARMRMERDPRAPMETSMAKYHASSGAQRAARAAVQLHGAKGCSDEYGIGRLLRDATVMGVVEGTNEIHQLSLARYAYQRSFREI